MTSSILTMQKSLTEFELEGFKNSLNLSDGHAYHDLSPNLKSLIPSLPEIWSQSSSKTPLDLEEEYLDSFRVLIRTSHAMQNIWARPAPTASNSIDIVGAALSLLGLSVALIEPTFDNIAQLLRRRGVPLTAVSEIELKASLREDSLNKIIGLTHSDAVFLVNPNNPTGWDLEECQFRMFVNFCRDHNKILIVDSSFRLFSRNLFDDLAIIMSSGVSFILIEDTGKAFPTLDTKISLLLTRGRARESIERIYNELYLCASGFALALHAQINKETVRCGLPHVLWDIVDARNAQLTDALAGSALVIDRSNGISPLGVTWIDCSSFGADIETRDFLLQQGIAVLPGRNFFWSNEKLPSSRKHVRVSVLKPDETWNAAIHKLHSLSRCEFNA